MGSWLKPKLNNLMEIYHERLKTYQAVVQAPSNPDLPRKA